jgi:hypothetical protein
VIGEVYLFWWRIYRGIDFFQVRISHVLRIMSICNLFTDSPSYNLLFIYDRDFKSENYLEITRKEKLGGGWVKLYKEAGRVV